MRSLFPPRFLLSTLLAAPLLAGCLGNSGSPGPVPAGVATTPGDAMFSVTWSDPAPYSYWMFLSQNPTLDSINWGNLADGRAIQNVQSPTTVCNQPIYSLQGVSYSILNGGAVTYVTINARTGSSKGGPGSPLVYGQARAAGGTWTASAPVSATIRGIGYATITGCGAGGHPPSGRFVAVGPGGGLFFADWRPLMAGQPSQPLQALSWSPVSPPPGFSGALNGVATRVAGITSAGVAAVRYVAVGDAGAILASGDGSGLVWSVVGAGATSSNLRAVSAGGAGLFTAVGDAGAILTSADGSQWSAIGAGVTQENLRAVRCVSTACVAAGDNGALLTTGNGGTTWLQAPFSGLNNWRAVAYGNGNANADYASVGTGVYAINTWVAGDDQGNIAWSANGGVSWNLTSIPGAAAIVGIEYSSRFLAVDALGNDYVSEDGRYWTPTTPTGLRAPIAVVGTGAGFLAIDASGSTSLSF